MSELRLFLDPDTILRIESDKDVLNNVKVILRRFALLLFSPNR
jgi:hypothetical protein